MSHKLCDGACFKTCSKIASLPGGVTGLPTSGFGGDAQLLDPAKFTSQFFDPFCQMLPQNPGWAEYILRLRWLNIGGWTFCIFLHYFNSTYCSI